jgi:transposase
VRRTPCTRPGRGGALLRREGLYTSHLTYWRRQARPGRPEGAVAAAGPQAGLSREVENAELRRRLDRTEAGLAKARKVIEVQGNVSALLGELLEPKGAERSDKR